MLKQMPYHAKLWPGKSLMPICLLAAYFIFLLLFVSPYGSFPLNDDWSYGEGVKSFLANGSFIMPTVCAIGFTHVILGAIACKIFGFSYAVLRITVLIIGFFGSAALYGSLRQLNIQRHAAIFCTLLYAANPLMVNLYFSFMSDVTALSLLNIYIYILLRSVKRNSLALAILSIIIFSLATYTRQSAIIFVPCNLAILSIKSKNRALLYFIFVISLVVPVFFYGTIDHWLSHRGLGSYEYLDSKQVHLNFIKSALSSSVHTFYNIVVSLGQTFCYLSLFSLPLLIPFIGASKRLITKYWHSLSWNFCFAAATILTSAKELVLNQGKLMPFNQNLLRLPMTCALTIMGLNMPLLPPRRLRWLTILSFFLSWILLTVIGSVIPYLVVTWHKFNRSKSISRHRFAAIALCAGALFTSLAFSIIETIVRCSDRYYLIALAPLILVLAIISRWLKLKIVQPLSVILLILIAFYSACAAQDYLGWNRARWIELDRLEARGIPSSLIDGGYEYNTLRDIKIYGGPYHGDPPRDKWRWWPIKGEKYIVSFSPIPDYKVIDRISYWSALSFSNLDVLVLEKENKQ